ncbi:MAG: glycoside hydrolase family 3 C-terminal domain-containing protein, partial [Bacteroidaceae bacterium]|nr:glycoside hydrolase family 3 C-terminal domain-containing protein [Bacteroidaceae bacterium]
TIKPRNANNFMQLENVVMPESLLSQPFKLRADAIANDIAIITIGRSCGESSDREYDGNYTLTDVEKKMINDVCVAFHTKGKKVVVVLNIGAPIETSNWKEKPDAILLAGLPGQVGGYAIGDILKGTITPSGKLVDTYVNNFNDIPTGKNFPVNHQELNAESRRNRNNPNREPIKNFDYTDYAEGLDVGYRYFDKYPELVSYPVGYGLSYTTFEYSNPTIKTEADLFKLTVTVKNTGKYAGKEAVQVYVTAPESKLVKPVKELKAFAKTKELKPGEEEVLEFTFKQYDLASYNESMAAWVTEAGYYQVSFAASAQDIRQTASFNIAQEIAYPTTATLQ